MKILLKNITVFIVLAFASSSLISCTKTADSSSGSTANANSATAKNIDSPPMSAAIMKAEIKAIDGDNFKLEDKKGKVILVNLWAIYCQPCIAEMPELVALQDKYRGNNFEIIGLDSNDEETPDDIREFAKKMKLNYQLGYADARMMNDFLKVTKFGGIPQSYLIDREGRLRNVFVGGGTKNVNLIKESVEKVVNE
jgi:thiol-disulfide isomerase/thioredoxin